MLLALAGCASSTAPIASVDSKHPASASAPEADRPTGLMLRADAATRRTHALIAQREAHMEQPVAEPTSSGGQIAKPDGGTNNPSSKGGHEHHQQ